MVVSHGAGCDADKEDIRWSGQDRIGSHHWAGDLEKHKELQIQNK